MKTVTVSGQASFSFERATVTVNVPMPKPEPRPETPRLAALEVSHAPDFASVSWEGEVYTFTSRQREIVAMLWAAMEAGHHYVGGDYLMEQAGYEGTNNLGQIFRAHPAWGRMIVQGVMLGGVQGSYRLAPVGRSRIVAALPSLN